MRIRTAGPEDVPGILGLSDALFREDDGCRDPTTNLEWALQEGRGRVVRRPPSRRCGRLLAGGACSLWGCGRVPGGPPVRSGLPSAGEHVCPREVQGPRRGSEAGRLGRKLPQHTDSVTAAEVRPTLPWREHLARRPVSQDRAPARSRKLSARLQIASEDARSYSDRSGSANRWREPG